MKYLFDVRFSNATDMNDFGYDYVENFVVVAVIDHPNRMINCYQLL